ncbi:replication initiator protein A [Salmonella enterica]|nr:replication initiator protein A [Salmonella enterica]
MNDPRDKQRERNLKTLRPRKNEIDFFIADEVVLSSFRDEMASMEHPFFALKGGDTAIRRYESGNIVLTVRPSVEIGLATIFDKDVWIYAISKMQDSINRGEAVSSKVVFTPYDFFVTTNRDRGGRSYKELEKALDRLKGTTIKTNINQGIGDVISFGLIEKWRVQGGILGDLKKGMIEIELPNWLIEALKKKKVLKISPDYFRIRKATDRRIYEIARKHCGNQGEFGISLEKLHVKAGSSATKEKFRYNIKQLAKSNDLPDYSIQYDPERDMVMFKNRNLRPEQVEREQQREQGKREVFKAKKVIADSKASHKQKGRKYVVDICNPGEPDNEIPPGFRG